MTTYTMSTEDREEALLHIQAPRMSLMMWEWEQCMRSAYRHESGPFHNAINAEDPVEAIRELWYEFKEDFKVYEEVE